MHYIKPIVYNVMHYIKPIEYNVMHSIKPVVYNVMLYIKPFVYNVMHYIKPNVYYVPLQKGEQRGHSIIIKTTHTLPHMHIHTSTRQRILLRETNNTSSPAVTTEE